MLSSRHVVVFAVAVVVACRAAPVRPVFPPSYSAVETVQLVRNGAPAQKGTTHAYHERGASGNKTALLSIEGFATDTVYDFDKQETFVLDHTDHDRCMYYCGATFTPLACNLADSLCAYSYLHSAAFAKTATVQGVACNVYEWVEALGPIPMNYLTLWVDVATNSIPVQMARNITPFGGASIGVEYVYWQNFTVGTPPASVFNIPDQQYCQEKDDDDTCNGDGVAATPPLERAPGLLSYFPPFATYTMHAFH